MSTSLSRSLVPLRLRLSRTGPRAGQVSSPGSSDWTTLVTSSNDRPENHPAAMARGRWIAWLKLTGDETPDRTGVTFTCGKLVERPGESTQREEAQPEAA